MNRILGATLFSVATIVGCAGTDENSEVPSQVGEALVIEHSASELAALKAGEILRIDLTGRDIHIVAFTNLADLEPVRIVTVDEEWSLSELVDTLDPDTQRLVLGADQAAVEAYFATQPEGGLSQGDPRGVAAQARIKLTTVEGCVDPTGIGPVVCDRDPPRRGED